MFESPTAIFHHQVLDAYDRYRTQRDACLTGSNRLLNAATTLAVALHHFGEVFGVIPGVTEADFPASKIVEEVANAVKHGRRRGKSPRIYLNVASALQEMVFVTEYSENGEAYYHCDVRVVAHCLDGSELDLDKPLIEYLNAWICHLHQLGHLQDVVQQPAVGPGSTYVSREAAKSVGYEVNRQVGLNTVTRLQRFDPSQGLATPIDLTGSTFQFRVLAPPKRELVIKLSDPTGARELEALVVLTDDEAARLDAATALGLGDAMIEQIARNHHDELTAQIQVALNALDENKTAT